MKRCRLKEGVANREVNGYRGGSHVLNGTAWCQGGVKSDRRKTRESYDSDVGKEKIGRKGEDQRTAPRRSSKINNLQESPALASRHGASGHPQGEGRPKAMDFSVEGGGKAGGKRESQLARLYGRVNRGIKL